MGLSENGCRRAAIATQNNVEAAMEWYFAHSEDPDFNDPPAAASGVQEEEEEEEAEALTRKRWECSPPWASKKSTW